MEPPEDASHQPLQEQLPTWKQDLVGKDIQFYAKDYNGDLESPAWFSCQVARFNTDGEATIIFNDRTVEGVDLIGAYYIDGTTYLQGKPCDTVAPPAPDAT